MKKPRIKTKDAVAIFGGHTALARALGISPPSTHGRMWKPYVPPLREYQLRELRPTIDAEIEKQRRSR